MFGRQYSLGLKPYDELVAAVRSVGHLKIAQESRPFPTHVDAVIKDGRTVLAKVSFYANSDAASLRLLWPEEGSHKIMAGGGRIATEEQMELIMEEVEALLRAHQVLKKRFPFSQYPSDRSLRRWARETMAACRKDGKFAPKTAAAKAAWAELAAAAGAFDRERALALRDRLSALGGNGADRSLAFMARTATSMAETPFRRAALALDDGSSQAFLYKEPPPAPGPRP